MHYSLQEQMYNKFYFFRGKNNIMVLWYLRLSWWWASRVWFCGVF